MLSTALGEIITFYSYKGGTGRSMALSNVACILAERQSKGKGILMIDWDLEAPGLHRYFHDKFKRRFDNSTESINKFNLHPGLIDLFIEFERLSPKAYLGNSDESEKNAIEILKNIDLKKFVIETDIPQLSLLKAGCFDKNYSMKVNTLNWEELYNRSPYLFISFAEKLIREYKYVLIDSRTGYTDISGICTALMPHKLVVVFTPNRQNYMGVSEIVRTATEYRAKSEDLRPLLVYPLPTRIESSRDDLRAEWRFGSSEKLIKGYQPMFEELFTKVYDISNCNLNNYFEDVQIQQSPDYAYGEEIAVMVERIEDRFSLSKSYRVFTEWLLESSAPWQKSKHGIPSHKKSNVPYSRNSYFTDREIELKQIHNALLMSPSEPVTIFGLGGIGKTQIAIEYAYRYRDEYEFVLWVKAYSKESIISDYISIAKLLDLHFEDNSYQNYIVSDVIKWLQTNDNWLLIFDDVDELDLIKGFFPTYMQGHILLTSRKNVFNNLGVKNSIEIKKMTREGAKEFFLKRTERRDLDSSELNSLEELINEIDCLPLAMGTAGAYIYNMNLGFSEYLSSYRRRGLSLLEKNQVSDIYPKSVTTTWISNFEKIGQISTSSLGILFVSAFLNPSQIPVEIFIKGAKELGSEISSAFEDIKNDPVVLDEILEPLMQYCLITRDTNNNTYDIHQLVQTVVRERMDEATQQLWIKRVVKALNCTFPEVEYKNWELCEKLLPHIQTCIKFINIWDLKFEESINLLNSTGNYLYERARFEECELLFNSALKIIESIFGPENIKAVNSLNNLAVLYKNKGQYSEAEKIFSRVLKITKKELGPEHICVSVCLNNLAGIYKDIGEYEKALDYYKQALYINEKILGPENSDISIILNYCAEIYKNMGGYAEALSLYQRALKIGKKALGSENPDIVITLNNLAGLYKNIGEYEKALPLYKQALEIGEKALGPENPDIITTLNNLAGLYKNMGEYEKASFLYQRALKIGDKVLGPGHILVVTTLNSLAELYESVGEYKKALSLYKHAQSESIKWDKLKD